MSRAVAIAVLLGAMAPAAIPGATRAAPLPSAWYLANQPVVTSSEAGFTSYVQDGMTGVNIGSPVGHAIAFIGPHGGPILPGTYHDIPNTPATSADVAMASSIGCPFTVADFTIHQATYAGDGTFSSLAVDFQVTCTGDFTGTWNGALRFQSSVGLGALVASPGWFDGGDLATTQTASSTQTLQNQGTAPVAVSALAVGGAAATSWAVGNDGCSGTVLGAGASCQFALTFQPATSGTLPANVSVLSDAAVPSFVAVHLTGHGRIPTTVTVDTSIAQPAVGQPFWVRATVSPTPDLGIVDIWLDGAYLGRADVDSGHAVGEFWVGQGVTAHTEHVASASFYSLSDNATSATDEYHFTAADTTATSITASRSQTYTDLAVTLTAGVTGPIGLTGGTLTIRDETTGVDLKSVAVTDVVHGTSVSTKLAAGSHLITSNYSGAAGFAPSITGMTVTVLADTGVAVTATMPSSQTFYPYKDGYRDSIAIGAHLDEPASVSIAIYRPDGSRLRTVSLGTRSTTYKYTWTGRTSTGSLYPSGTYRIIQTLKDGTGHIRRLSNYATLSAKRLYTSTVYITRLPSQVSRKTAEWAAWSFSLPSATIYRSLTFQVYGRSTDGQGIYIGGQDFRICPTSVYDPTCVGSVAVVGYATTWTSKWLSVNYNRSGRTARGYVTAIDGAGVVYKVRLKVTYQVLK